MYNPLLKTFIEVADSGSFTKASKKLFISSTAVIKQINSLEHHLGFSLFLRTKHGVVLTENGKEIYKESKSIISYSESILQKFQKNNQEEYLLRIGTSILCPCMQLMDLWNTLDNKLSLFKVKIISFDDDNSNILYTLKNLGNSFDLILSACDSKSWLSICNYYELGSYNFCVSVPKSNPLSKKKSLKLEDLNHQTIMIMREGESKSNSQLRLDIKNTCLDATIIDAPYFYDLETFNQAEQNGNLLITLDCWKELHPSLVAIPLETNLKIPYGILYSKSPNQAVIQLIQTLEKNKKWLK